MKTQYIVAAALTTVAAGATTAWFVYFKPKKEVEEFKASMKLRYDRLKSQGLSADELKVKTGVLHTQIDRQIAVDFDPKFHAELFAYNTQLNLSTI